MPAGTSGRQIGEARPKPWDGWVMGIDSGLLGNHSNHSGFLATNSAVSHHFGFQCPRSLQAPHLQPAAQQSPRAIPHEQNPPHKTTRNLSMENLAPHTSALTNSPWKEPAPTQPPDSRPSSFFLSKPRCFKSTKHGAAQSFQPSSQPEFTPAHAALLQSTDPACPIEPAATASPAALQFPLDQAVLKSFSSPALVTETRVHKARKSLTLQRLKGW